MNIINGKSPSMLMRNPFAFDNLKQYLLNYYPYYETLESEYINCKTKMRFICHRHEDKGIQYNTPDNVINNHHACRYCGYEEMGKERCVDEDKIIKRCNELSLEFVSRESGNGESIISFICPKHRKYGIQKMSWDKLKQSVNGCRYCHASSGEIAVRKELDDLNIEYIEQKTFDDCKYKNLLRFDFYIPSIKTAIEYDGKQHFEPISFSNKGKAYAEELFKATKLRDEIKNNYCEENNISIIRIPYTEHDNIHEFLKERLVI